MAQTTQSGRPASMTAGDSLTWRESAPDGAANDPDLRATYHFRHMDSGALFSADGVSAASGWEYTLKGLDTAEKPTGLYGVSLVITGAGGTRTTIAKGTLQLLIPLDRPATESHAAKMVRLLQSHLEGRIDDGNGRGLESYTIAGVPITKISHTDARALLVDYRIDLENERRKERAAAGLGTGRRILTEFQN